jgi:hypothetical protein
MIFFQSELWAKRHIRTSLCSLCSCFSGSSSARAIWIEKAIGFALIELCVRITFGLLCRSHRERCLERSNAFLMSARALHYECIDIFESLLDTPADGRLLILWPRFATDMRWAGFFLFDPLSLCVWFKDGDRDLLEFFLFCLSKGKSVSPTAAKTYWIN